MGTPNRLLKALDWIRELWKRLYASQVTPDVTPKEWGKRAAKAIHAVTPKLPYMSRLETLGDMFLGYVKDGVFRPRVCANHTTWGRGLQYGPWGKDTLCVLIAVVSEHEWTAPTKGYYTEECVERTELLLTRAGDVLTWGWSAEMLRRSTEFGRKLQSPRIDEVALWSEITHVKGDRLQEVLSRPGVGQQVLQRLAALVNQTVKKREESLVSLKALQTVLENA